MEGVMSVPVTHRLDLQAVLHVNTTRQISLHLYRTSRRMAHGSNFCVDTDVNP